MTGKKRKYEGNQMKNWRRNNVSDRNFGGNNGSLLRAGGGPAVLFTCESGRESKVRREAMQLFDHYYKISGEEERQKDPNSKMKDSALDQKLSLEDEIAKLKEEENQSKRGLRSSNFSVCRDYDVKGTVLVQCNILSCIPLKVSNPKQNDSHKAEDDRGFNYDVSDDKTTNDETNQDATQWKKMNKHQDEERPISKRMKVDASFYKQWEWDPVNFVRKVLQDSTEISIGEKNPHDISKPLPPTSRFISRCIPMQATCYTSLEEIEACAKPLVEHFIFENVGNNSSQNSKTSTVTTFNVSVKVRNCSNLKRMDIVDVIAKMFEPPRYKVDLSNPDFSVVVEICKTICGISVVEKPKLLRNFNVQEIRQDALDKKEL